MKTAAFLICICFLLLSGSNAFVATSHRIISYASNQHSINNHHLKFTHSPTETIVTGDIDFNRETDYFINEENEDEDVNRAPARKCKTINNCYLTLQGIIILPDHYSSCDTRPFNSSLSNKYISQRTLRI